jgi:hypothetical protein
LKNIFASSCRSVKKCSEDFVLGSAFDFYTCRDRCSEKNFEFFRVMFKFLTPLSTSNVMHTFIFAFSVPVTPKKNTKAFGSSGATASVEWYDSKIPNCIDFDKPGMNLS